MEIRQIIIETLQELLVDNGAEIAAPLAGDTLLLKTGLDSLGFAVLVVRLEERLGYDPFVLMAEAVYPRTLDEFVAIYEACGDHAAAI
jgi:acyl carrier protein